MGYLLLQTDNQESCWLGSARAVGTPRREARLKYSLRTAYLALHHARLYQLSSCTCPSQCSREDSRSLLPTPHSRQHRHGKTPNPKPQGCSEGDVQTPFFCLQERGGGRTDLASRSMFTVSLSSTTSIVFARPGLRGKEPRGNAAVSWRCRRGAWRGCNPPQTTLKVLD